MSKKIIIINIMAMVIVGTSVLYFLNLRGGKETPSEISVERPTGVFYKPLFSTKIAVYPGAKFVMDYRNKSLLARYYIVREEQDKIIDFYQKELENFKVVQDVFTAGHRHFTMGNQQMIDLSSVEDGEDRLVEAHEMFYDRKSGSLVAVEIGRQPAPFWNYSYFYHDRPNAPEETMIVLWFYYPDVK